MGYIKNLLIEAENMGIDIRNMDVTQVYRLVEAKARTKFCRLVKCRAGGTCSWPKHCESLKQDDHKRGLVGGEQQ